jgi:uncharacterized protein
MNRVPVQVVLDTQVWLDWLVFEDPGMAFLRGAHAAGLVRIVIDEACESELARVLAYDFGRFTLAPAAQLRCRAKVREIAHLLPADTAPPLPRCRDPDDQKFLELAALASADLLVTKDLALLALSGHPLPFRIVRPVDCRALIRGRRSHD